MTQTVCNNKKTFRTVKKLVAKKKKGRKCNEKVKAIRACKVPLRTVLAKRPALP